MQRQGGADDERSKRLVDHRFGAHVRHSVHCRARRHRRQKADAPTPAVPDRRDPNSAPTYAVIGDYAPNLGVRWPNRPKHGRYAAAHAHAKQINAQHAASSKAPVASAKRPVDKQPSVLSSLIKQVTATSGKRPSRRQSAERVSSAESAPTYAVVGDYAPQLDVYWPERPARGRYASRSRQPVKQTAAPEWPCERQRMGARRRACGSGEYVGARETASAEALLERGCFVLYYPTPAEGSGRLPTQLSLTVAYRTSGGDFRHYLLRVETGKYFVDCGDPRAPRFGSLQLLVDYHRTYVFLQRGGDGRNGKDAVFDTFPWWLTPALGKRV